MPLCTTVSERGSRGDAVCACIGAAACVVAASPGTYEGEASGHCLLFYKKENSSYCKTKINLYSVKKEFTFEIIRY